MVVAISRNWNGKVFGTNTGNVSLALTGMDDNLAGVIRLSDDRFGVVVYDATATFTEGTLSLAGKPAEPPPDDVHVGDLTVLGALTEEGRIDGEWSTTIGTGGTFQLWPHSMDARSTATSTTPEQLNISIRTVGAVRLYADDVRSLIAHILKEFTETRAVVTFNDNGSEKNMYSHDFIELLEDLPELRYIKISAQEHEKYGINKLVMVEFAALGENVVRVQSVHEAWAIGKSEALACHINGFQRKLVTHFRKYGLNINVAVSVVALAALPALQGFGRRMVFAVSVWGLLVLFKHIHNQYIPNFVLYPTRRSSTLLGSIVPGVLSWAITIIGAVIGAIIYGLLKGELANSPMMNTILAFVGPM